MPCAKLFTEGMCFDICGSVYSSCVTLKDSCHHDNFYAEPKKPACVMRHWLKRKHGLSIERKNFPQCVHAENRHEPPGEQTGTKNARSLQWPR